jgi:hypothetical protein
MRSNIVVAISYQMVFHQTPFQEPVSSCKRSPLHIFYVKGLWVKGRIAEYMDQVNVVSKIEFIVLPIPYNPESD